MNLAKRNKIINTGVLAIVGLIMLMPLAWMVSASFKYESDVFKMPIQWIPKNPTFQNYKIAVSDFPYMHWYLNTFMSTLSIVFLVLFISALAGYSFAKLKFRHKEVIFFLFISTMMIPSQVRIIPQFILFRYIHLIDTLGSIILPWMYCPFAIFMMKQFFASVPDELIEAARIDGSSETGTYFRIVLPLARSQFAALGILAFTWGWNQYFVALVFIRTQTKQILSVGIAMFKSTYTDNYGIQMAGASLALIPIIIVYLIFQKQFIESIALSGVKG
jgi:multiple sugar transport system permease protein